MDTPLLTLNWLNCLAFDASSDGKWTGVVANQGIFVYDRNGKLQTHQEGSYSYNLIKHFQFQGDELGYLKDSEFYIVSLPALDVVDVYNFKDRDVRQITFNDTWLDS